LVAICERKDHLGDLRIDGLIMLIAILRKWICFRMKLINFTEDSVQCRVLLKSVIASVSLGGLVVSVLAPGPTGYFVAGSSPVGVQARSGFKPGRGSSPTEDGGFLRVIKIHSTHFLRRGSKAVGPMSVIYGMLKNPTQHEWDALSAKFPDLLLTHDILLLRYQMALVVVSGWFESVLWQRFSHLLLKYTK
jgi:hypothetical protein